MIELFIIGAIFLIAGGVSLLKRQTNESISHFLLLVGAALIMASLFAQG